MVISAPSQTRLDLYDVSFYTNTYTEEEEGEGEESDDGWAPVPEAEVAAVMRRYHELQQEFVDQQLALAPSVIPDNQVGPCAACWHV
jgi:hypothetical protein